MHPPARGGPWLRSTARCILLAAALLALTAGPVSAHPNGTVFSSPVDADAAALFWNPAAMAAATRSRFDLVANASIIQGAYQRFGTDDQQGGRPFPRVSLVSVRPEPTIGIILDKLWHSRLRLGISISVPTAVGAAWPETVNDNGHLVLGPTRYHVTDAAIFHVFTQIGASLALHRTFAIGFAVNVVASRVQVTKHVDLANQAAIRNILPCADNPAGCENPTLSAPLHLEGSGVSAGGSVGIMWQPIQRVRIGVGYVSPVKVPVPLVITLDSDKLTAFARQFLPSFQTLSLNGSGTAMVVVPQRLHAAIAVDVHPRVELMGMFTWVNNSATEIISGTVGTKSSTLLPDSLEIPSVHNDGFTALLRVVGRVKERWKLGLSIEYSARSVPEEFMTPANLDFDNVAINLGARLRLTPVVSLAASFSQTIVVPRDVTKSAFANEAPEPYYLPDPTGHWSGNAEKLGLDLIAEF